MEDSSRRNLVLFPFPSRLPPADNFLLFVCIPADFLLRELHFVSSGGAPFFARSTHTHTHSYTRATYLAYAQRYSLFRSGRNVQTRRTRPTRDTCCSFLLSFLSFFLPSFLPRVCLCFEVTVIRSIARTQFTWLFR